MPLHTCACLNHACRVCLNGQLSLSCFTVYHFSIVNSTMLYLFVEGCTVKTYIRAHGSFDQAVMEVVFGDETMVPTHTMTEPVRNCTLLHKVSSYNTVLALAWLSTCRLSLQLSWSIRACCQRWGLGGSLLHVQGYTPLWGGPAPVHHRSRSCDVGAIVLLELIPSALQDVITHVGTQEVSVFIVEVNIGLHASSYSHCNKPLYHCLFLGFNPLFFGIVSLPFCCEEVSEMAQLLALLLDLPFLFAVLAQPIDVRCDSCISYGLYCNWLLGVVIGWTDVSSRTGHSWDHVLARAVLIDWCLHCCVWWSFLVRPWCYVWCDGTIWLGSLYPHCRFSDWWTDGSLLVVLGYSLSVVV